ncbi:MAG: L-2-hydroxyglutarate oxidase [Candidatus Eisenbacteria bacterium]|nr:L-2-hydroxyglutarate oxidase [Candidatus Eisenbacteria bacterium]
MQADLAVIGGGIVGVAVAHALAGRTRARIALLEAEARLAAHQTGHNSGVIHSGLYYRPGSLKARNCVVGREALYEFCAREGLPHERCGKVVVATAERELPALTELERRGRENGLSGLRRLAPAEIRAREPHAAGIAGLLVPDTGIVDFTAVTDRLAERARERGAEVRTGARVRAVVRRPDEMILHTDADRDEEIRCRAVINCAGLQSDRIARLCGADPGVRIVPFRGEYFEFLPGQRSLVRHLIYPVPDPSMPFLGVHFTRMIGGGVEAGPNAVLAWKREGYRQVSFDLRDAWETLTFGGFWRLAQRFWRTALDEYRRSLSKAAFVRDLQRLVPETRAADLRATTPGIRAQALAPDGALVDDFHIVAQPDMIHLLNAPSPAATAALSIGETIAEMAAERFALRPHGG